MEVVKAKDTSIYGNYRNDLWYEYYFKLMPLEQAYTAVIENLKHPTFGHEKECAMRVFEKTYGVPFQSPERRTIESLEAENAKLRAAVEEVKSKPAEDIKDQPAQSANLDDFPKGMEKEAFKEFFNATYEKSQGVKPSGLIWGRAWKKYSKVEEKDEIPA